MEVSAPDLAAVCAELVGTAGTSAVMINRILRCYSDAPKELTNLKPQLIATKQFLDQMLSFLDSDPPAFRRRDDLTNISTYFSAIRALMSDAQRRAGRLESRMGGQIDATWRNVQDVWEDADIAACEERLGKQVTALGIYVNIAELDEKSQYLARLQRTRELNAARDDAINYIDVGIATYIEQPPPYEVLAPPEDGSNPHNILNGLAGPSVSNDPPPTDGIFRPLPPERSASTPSNDANHQAGSLLVPNGATANIASQSCTALVPQGYRFDPSESASPDFVRRINSDQTSDDPSLHDSTTRTKSGLSARRIKSMALLRKAKAAPLLPDPSVQGDALNPAEYKARLGGYNSGVTPVWRLVTLVGIKTPEQQRYRNRFSNDPGDDVLPSKMQSNFKIADKKLWDAILHNRTERVEEIMQHRWSDNIVVERQDSLTALHMAASLGLCGIVQILVTTGANPNSVDRFGLTPLHFAADFGCAGCLKILIDAGAKVNGMPPKASLKPPIWYAAAGGHVDAVNTLLNLGALFLNQITAVNETLLHVAVKSNSVTICSSLLAAGALPNESFSTLLMASSRSPELLSCLCEAGADINMRDTNQETLLHKYVGFGDLHMVRYILSLGGDPNLADASGRTALHAALVHGGPEIAPKLLKALLEKGADVGAQDGWGRTALHLAVRWGRADAVHLLCQSGADQNTADVDGESPWGEAQAPDYATRTIPASFPGNPTLCQLADFRKCKHILGQWRGGGPRRRKPTLTPLSAELPTDHDSDPTPDPAAAAALPAAPPTDRAVPGPMFGAVELPA